MNLNHLKSLIVCVSSLIGLQSAHLLSAIEKS